MLTNSTYVGGGGVGGFGIHTNFWPHSCDKSEEIPVKALNASAFPQPAILLGSGPVLNAKESERAVDLIRLMIESRVKCGNRSQMSAAIPAAIGLEALVPEKK